VAKNPKPWGGWGRGDPTERPVRGVGGVVLAFTWGINPGPCKGGSAAGEGEQLLRRQEGISHWVLPASGAGVRQPGWEQALDPDSGGERGRMKPCEGFGHLPEP